MDRKKLHYLHTLRLASSALAIFTWFVSVKFSADGFSIERPDYAWLGIGLALVCTCLQLIFNKGSFTNPTLFFGGLVAYAYGIAMNYRGMKALGLFAVDDRLGTGLTAVLIEILPEAMFLWGLLNGGGQGVGDFLSSLFTWTDLHLPRRRPRTNSSPQAPTRSVQMPPRTDVYGRMRKQADKRVDGQYHGQRDAKEHKAREFIREHLKEKGVLPSARQVPFVKKSKAAELLRDYR